MDKEYVSCFSEHLGKNMSIRIYGNTGVPVIVFPTQDAMSDNFENFGMVDEISDYIEAGKLQIFSVDTVDVETWSNVWGDKVWRAERQEAYYRYITDEALPFVRGRNKTGNLPLAVGCSLGGLHAAILFFRRPELFSGILSLSGAYDAKFFFDGWLNGTLYDNSPVDFLANMSTDHPYIAEYNKKPIILCIGQGAWEDEGRRTTAIMRDIFASKGIHGWTDFWGFDVEHDWRWWKKQIRYFLPYLLGEEKIK